MESAPPPIQGFGRLHEFGATDFSLEKTGYSVIIKGFITHKNQTLVFAVFLMLSSFAKDHYPK